MSIQEAETGIRRDTLLLLVGQLGIGGAERHMVSLANLLSRNFNVVLAYLKPDEAMLGELCRNLLVEVRCLHVSTRIDWRAARDLAELARKHSARIIVCANAYALLYAHMSRALSSEPLIVTEIFHTTKPRSYKEWVSLLFYRPFFWAAHHLVFVCQAQRNYWRPRGLCAQHIHMIYNGIDLTYFSSDSSEEQNTRTRKSLGFGGDDRVVGICAALRPEKAHADLISAIADLHHEGNNWRLLIIGDGPMRGAIEEQVTRLGLTESVRITGFQSDVRRFLVACDVVALVSKSETFSIAALEAMAMGKPMIMSDIGGAREQVTHGVNGLIFPAGDVPALVQCLRDCGDGTRTRQMGAAARRMVECRFSMQVMIDRYISLFRQILGFHTQTLDRSVDRS